MKRVDKFHIVLLITSFVLLCICIYFRSEKNRLLDNTIKERTGYHPKEVTHMQLSVERSWENCLRKLDIQRDIVFYGNSITRNGDFQRYFPEQTVCNLGHGGDDLDGMLRRIGMIVCLHPKKVFLMAGINDLADNIPIQLFADKYKRLVRAISDSIPEAKLYIQSLLPIGFRKYQFFGTNQKIDSINSIIRGIAEEQGITYINLYSSYLVDGELPEKYTADGLHLNPDSYSLWIDIIANYVNE